MHQRLRPVLVIGLASAILLIYYYNVLLPKLHSTSFPGSGWSDSTDAVYAIGDLHGDYVKAKAALGLAGVIGQDGYWKGGKATVVQLGDLMDRGAYSLDCIDIFERLKGEAEKAGGSVHTLLGNHELMNLEGQYQYVAKQELQRLLKDREPESMGFDQQKSESLAMWKEYIGPEYALGKALRQYPVALLKGEGACRTLFVHAGLLPGILTELQLPHTTLVSPEDLLQDLNRIAEGVLKCVGGLCKPSEEGLRLLHDPDGPLWYRGFVQQKERAFCSNVAVVLERLGAEQMVVGHNVVSSVRTLCKQTVYMIDVGMSIGVLGAGPTVWQCQQGRVSILT